MNYCITCCFNAVPGAGQECGSCERRTLAGVDVGKSPAELAADLIGVKMVDAQKKVFNDIWDGGCSLGFQYPASLQTGVPQTPPGKKETWRGYKVVSSTPIVPTAATPRGHNIRVGDEVRFSFGGSATFSGTVGKVDGEFVEVPHANGATSRVHHSLVTSWVRKPRPSAFNDYLGSGYGGPPSAYEAATRDLRNRVTAAVVDVLLAHGVSGVCDDLLGRLFEVLGCGQTPHPVYSWAGVSPLEKMSAVQDMAAKIDKAAWKAFATAIPDEKECTRRLLELHTYPAHIVSGGTAGANYAAAYLASGDHLRLDPPGDDDPDDWDDTDVYDDPDDVGPAIVEGGVP